VSIPIIGGSWHGHSAPIGPNQISLVQRSMMEALGNEFPDIDPNKPLPCEMYYLHLIRFAEGQPVSFYSTKKLGSEATAELLSHAAGTITTDMIRAALQMFAGPVYFIDAAGQAKQVVDAETGEEMVKTMWTKMQRARR
jgi:hypothetical protein